MRTIYMRVTGDAVTRDSTVAGVQGSGNVDQVVLAFDGSWDGYTKRCVWWDAHGAPAARRLLTAELLVDPASDTRTYMIPVPPEALRYGGECSLVVEGTAEGRRARSIAQSLRVVTAPLDETAKELTPGEVEQIQAQVDALLPKLREVLDSEKSRAGQEALRVEAETARAEAEVQREEDSQAATQAAWAAANHPPQVGPNGNWQVWSSQTGAYRDTGVAAQGPKGDTGAQGPKGDQGERGPRGETGPKGEDGALIDLETGVFAMSVSGEGHLLVSVNVQEDAPPLEIDEKGHLIYQIEA